MRQENKSYYPLPTPHYALFILSSSFLDLQHSFTQSKKGINSLLEVYFLYTEILQWKCFGFTFRQWRHLTTNHKPLRTAQNISSSCTISCSSTKNKDKQLNCREGHPFSFACNYVNDRKAKFIITFYLFTTPDHVDPEGSVQPSDVLLESSP